MPAPQLAPVGDGDQAQVARGDQSYFLADQTSQQGWEPLAVLGELGQRASPDLEPRAVFERTVQTAANLLGVEEVYLYLVSASAGSLQLGAWRATGDAAVEISLPIKESLLGEVLSTGQPVVIGALAEHPLWGSKQLDSDPPRSGLFVPFSQQQHPVGVLVALSRQDRPFHEADILLVQTLVSQVVLAIQNDQLLRELADGQTQMRELIDRLALAQEQERRHVASEIHDGLAQLAATAQQHLEAFAVHARPRSPRAKQELAAALELIRRTVREARRTITGLRPMTLDEAGLAAALRLEIEILQDEGWQITYRQELGDERLPPAIESAIFRVAQEALTNIRKHAGTDRAQVALLRRGQQVRLEVRDRGCGFRPAEALARSGAGERVGLVGMRERIAWLGGTCVVLSRPEEGTRIVVEIPLPESSIAGAVDQG